MGARLASRFAWSICGLSIALAAIGQAMFLMSGHVPDSAHGDHGPDPVIGIAFVGVTTVGALIVSRQTSNTVGWLLLGQGAPTLLGTNGLGYGYVQYALEGPSRLLPGAAWVAWLTNWTNFVGIIAFGALFIIFPTGQVTSPRWRLALRGVLLTAVYVGLEEALRPGPLSYFPQVDNPLGVGQPGPIATAVANVAALFVGGGLLIGAVSILARFRRSRGIERQQLKWVAFAVALVAGYFLLMNVAGTIWPDASSDSVASRMIGIGWGLAVLSMPLALGIAVLRYHLYAIDRIINRTLVYAALSVLLALVYWASVVVLQQVLRPITSGSDLAIVGSTLGVAALFQPLRRRIQHDVDRRFYRQHYDAALTLEVFSSHLRHEVDLDALGAELVEVVHQTMQPVKASLWLRVSSPKTESA